MNGLDVLIAVLVLLQAARGVAAGLSRQLFSLGGFLGGLAAGAALAPRAVPATLDPGGRLLVSVALVLGTALVLGAAGAAVGRRAADVARRLRLRPVDAALGGVAGAAASLVAIWLVASAFSGIPYGEVSRQIRDSRLLREVDRRLPPAPAVFARIGDSFRPGDFPDVFAGLEPGPTPPVPRARGGQAAAALRAAGASTVRIEATGCGGVLSGSGFVAAPGLVVTNAHVVAGARGPTVRDRGGARAATIVLLDTAQDLAVLRVDGHAGPPLPLAGRPARRGTRAVVLGYPRGGPLRAEPAGVGRRQTALGRDIHGERRVARTIYELHARVEAGNSGGPVVLSDGTVIGVLFARSDGSREIAYAIAAEEIRARLQRARVGAPVASGRCVR